MKIVFHDHFPHVKYQISSILLVPEVMAVDTVAEENFFPSMYTEIEVKPMFSCMVSQCAMIHYKNHARHGGPTASQLFIFKDSMGGV